MAFAGDGGVFDLLVSGVSLADGGSVADVGLDTTLRGVFANIGSEPVVDSSGLTRELLVCEFDLLKKSDTARIPFPFAEDEPGVFAAGDLGVPVRGVAVRSFFCADGGGVADVLSISGTRLCMTPSTCDSFKVCILSAKLWGF